jgi:GNAT superfamily N-acetyltransferase
MTYTIREVDGSDEDIEETIREMHDREPDFPSMDVEAFLHGFWWIASDSALRPVGFAGMVASQQFLKSGYLYRAGVLPVHRGHGLQRKLIQVREMKARKIGWTHIVSDCTDNIHSANNFIRAGYRLYRPRRPWAFSNTLYWRKEL